MSKIDLVPVTGAQNLSAINDNFQKIEEALNEKVLYRDNPPAEPNQVESDVDMNGKRLYNLPEPKSDGEPVRRKEFGDIKKSIRVDDKELPTLPPASVRRNKLLSFDAVGNPVVSYPSNDSATQLRLDLNSYTGNISADAEWSDVPAHSDPAFDVQAQALADRVEWLKESLDKKAYGTVSVAEFMGDQDFLDIASGVESQGVREAVRLAVEHVNAVGGKLYFPPGHYKIPYLSPSDISNWIEITKSGVSFIAAPGSVILENFLFYVHGGYGAPQIVGSAGFTTGSTQINTALPHNLVEGDYVQLLTAINPYTPDAGEWQLGSQNPTNLIIPACRHSEIHRVNVVDSTTTATLYDSVIYADYRDNTTGQSFPLTGVSGAEIRKLTPVVGVNFYGLAFKNVTASSFREILIRSAVDVTFSDCHFEAAGHPGVHVKSTDTLNLTFIGCTSYRNPQGASGSSWNSFIPSGGTQNIVFSGCSFVGEQQSIDVSPNLLSTDIGYTGSEIRAEYITAQNISITDCKFTKCSDGFTTHPATYNLVVNSCLFEGCSTGLRVRSKRNTITGNTFKTYRIGVSFSAFYEDTLFSGNTLEQLPQPVSQSWEGVRVAPLSSEIMNNNNLKNVVIEGNTFRVTQANTENAGILFRHAGNGVPANGSFELFTNEIKTAYSNYIIENNSFIGCSVKVNRWINGVIVSRNSFSDGSDASHYIVCVDNSARNTIQLNYFRDNLVPAFTVGNVSSPVFPYATDHRIGYQYSDRFNITATVNNASGVFTQGFGLPVYDGVTVQNSGRIQAVRATGASTLRLDAVALDGTSAVDIRVFDQNTTTGTKTFEVAGRVRSEHSYPRTTNTYTSGISTSVWAGGFTQTAFTVTSDEREKQDILDLSDAEKRVAVALKRLVKSFRFKSAVATKGDGARIHFGVMAQDVKAAFEAEGLNAFDYALLCYDEWGEQPELKDDDGNTTQEYRPAGNRYGIRYEELLAFILAAM